MVALFLLSEQLITLRTTEKILTWKIGDEIYTKLGATLVAFAHEDRGTTGITQTKILVWIEENQPVRLQMMHFFKRDFQVFWMACDFQFVWVRHDRTEILDLKTDLMRWAEVGAAENNV